MPETEAALEGRAVTGGRRAQRSAQLRDRLATGLRVEQAKVQGAGGLVPVRWYWPEQGGLERIPLLWVHGGGFCGGGLDQLESHAVASAIARTGRPVVTLDYRLSPQFSLFGKPGTATLDGIRFPDQLDDVVAVFDHVRSLSRSGGVFLGGASAGACLSAAATISLRSTDDRVPDGLVLAYGIFHAALPAKSGALKARLRGVYSIPQFSPALVDRMNYNYAGSPAALRNPLAFPGGGDLSRFPATLMIDADRDALRASGEEFGRELKAAGADVDYSVAPGVLHGFLDRPLKPAFGAAIARVTRWLEVHEAT